jgi:hypothetical protein
VGHPHGTGSEQAQEDGMNTAHTRRWPLALIALPAAVVIWSGWVGLGSLCGFGLVQPLPGIVAWHLDTAITLPIGVEAYGAYALGAWLTPGTPEQARVFARRSAVGALTLGMLGQVVYHLLAATRATRAPWPVVVLVSCLPVITLGFGAALTHLLRVPALLGSTLWSADETALRGAPGFVGGGQADAVLAELADAVRALTDRAADVVSSPASGGDENGLLAELLGAVRGLGPLIADAVSSPVPSGAEHAALIAYRATLAAGNPYSMNSLAARFGLTRTQVTRIRSVVAGENGGQVPGEADAPQLMTIGHANGS